MNSAPLTENVVHCWEDYHDWIAQQHGTGSDEWITAYEKPSATCMLCDGHDGPHEWTPDESITVEFAHEQ